MKVYWSVLVPLLLAEGIAGDYYTPTMNNTELAAQAIKKMEKMFDEPAGPSLFQQFIEALQRYTDKAVNEAVNRAFARLAPLIGLDNTEDYDEFASESSQMDPSPMFLLDHRLQALDRQSNEALQNYMEALDQYREIQPKLLKAEDLDSQAWLENEKAKIDFYEIRYKYVKDGVTNLLDKEDYKQSLLKWQLTNKRQLEALESLIDVRKVFVDVREQYMHAKKLHTFARQRYLEINERYPQIPDREAQIWERYLQPEVTSVEHEEVAGPNSQEKNVNSSNRPETMSFPERSEKDGENGNLSDYLKFAFNPDQASAPLPARSLAALHSNVEWQGPVEDKVVGVDIEANGFSNEEETLGPFKSRRRRSSGWDTLSALNPLNANFTFFNNVLSGDFSILDLLFEDSPQVIYCPATGLKLIRCVGDQLFQRVVKSPIQTLGSWFSELDDPEFYV